MVPVFLRKHIETCDFPGGRGPDPPFPPLDLLMQLLFNLLNSSEENYNMFQHVYLIQQKRALVHLDPM